MLREGDKHFLASLYAGLAIIFIWKGLWEGAYVIPYVPHYILNPFVFLFLGLVILTFSGFIFKEFDPLGGLQKSLDNTVSGVLKDPDKKKFTIKYYDKFLRKEVSISGDRLKKFEKGAIVAQHSSKKQEIFIPTHRVTEILYKGKRHWRA